MGEIGKPLRRIEYIPETVPVPAEPQPAEQPAYEPAPEKEPVKAGQSSA